jgi:hypothetical protein
MSSSTYSVERVLDVFQQTAGRVRSPIVNLSIRQLEELTDLNRRTVIDALTVLRDAELVVPTSASIGPLARIYRVERKCAKTAPPTCCCLRGRTSAGRSLEASDLACPIHMPRPVLPEGRSGDHQEAGPLDSQASVPPVGQLARVDSAHAPHDVPVGTARAIGKNGKAAERLLRELTRACPETDRQWYLSVGMPRRTFYRAKPRLNDLGLVEKRDAGWSTVPDIADRLADLIESSGAGASMSKNAERNEADRERHEQYLSGEWLPKSPPRDVWSGPEGFGPFDEEGLEWSVDSNGAWRAPDVITCAAPA